MSVQLSATSVIVDLESGVSQNTNDIINLSGDVVALSAEGIQSEDISFLSGEVSGIQANYVTTDTIQTITAQKTISKCSLSDPTLQKIKMSGGVNVNGSVAIGNVTSALADGSFTQGWRTRTDKMWQTVVGAWNEDDLAAGISGAYPFIVGNGSDGNRSNAFLVGYDGSIFVQTSAKIQDFVEVNGGRNFGSLSADPGIQPGDTYYNTVSSRHFVNHGLGPSTLAVFEEIPTDYVTESYVSSNFVSLTANESVGGNKTFTGNFVDFHGTGATFAADIKQISGPPGSGDGRVTLNDASNTAVQVSVAMGLSATAGAPYSLAHGEECTTNGIASHAEGLNCQTNSDHSHAEGVNCAVGPAANGSHAEGNFCTTGGSWSHAEGVGTQTFGDNSHSEGDGSQAIGDGSHAEGLTCDSSGNHSHAEGENSLSIGVASHAEGKTTNAFGDYSHTEGEECVANGIGAHAEGYQTKANGDYSHTAGDNTETDRVFQNVIGIWNELDTVGGLGTPGEYPFIVGNGFGSGQRSNAFAVGYDGYIQWGQLPTAGHPGIKHFGASNGTPATPFGGFNAGDRYFNLIDDHETVFTASSGWVKLSY